MSDPGTPPGQPELRAFLQAIHDGLGQPPLGAQLRASIIAALNLLAEHDLERRVAVRERIADLLAEQDRPPQT